MFVFLRPLIDQQITVYSGSSTSGDVEEPAPSLLQQHPLIRQTDKWSSSRRQTGGAPPADRQVHGQTGGAPHAAGWLMSFFSFYRMNAAAARAVSVLGKSRGDDVTLVCR